MTAAAAKTGYARVNGLNMYYEVHGSGQPLALLHGRFFASPGKSRPKSISMFEIPPREAARRGARA